MMTNSQPLHSSNGRNSAADGISPVGVLVALGRNWKLVIATACVAGLAGVAHGFLRTPLYSAETLLFLSEGTQTSPASQLASQFGVAGGMGGGAANARLVTTIMGSRALADSVARQTGSPEGTHVQSNPDGSIRITVMHRNPEMASRIANTFPEVLNALVSRNGVQTNRRKESLLERQIAEARVRLEQSEDRLVGYQAEQNAGDVDAQAAATVTAAIRLQERIAEKEVGVLALRRTATPNNPQLRAATADLAALRQQLERLSSGGGGMGQILVPLRQGPALRVGATRLLREYTRNEQIYIALTAALAQAQIELNGTLPVVTVVDPAPVPTVPGGSGPLALGAVAAVLGLVAGALIAIAVDVVRRMRRDPERDPFLAVWQGIHDGRVARVPARR